MKLAFDKKIFNTGNGAVYTVLQYVFSLGFLAGVVLILLRAIWKIQLSLPDILLPLIAGYIFVSFPGFPIVSAMKLGARRLLTQSQIELKQDGIVYTQLKEKVWTFVGRMVGQRIYQTSQITSVRATKFNYVISGTIELTVLHNGQILETETISSMKIPKAYKDMERMMTYGR